MKRSFPRYNSKAICMVRTRTQNSTEEIGTIVLVRLYEASSVQKSLIAVFYNRADWRLQSPHTETNYFPTVHRQRSARRSALIEYS